MRRTLASGTLAALLVGGVVTTASATPAGDFYACLKKDGKVSEMSVNAVPTCKKGETLVQWNQMGPPGLQGPKGASGTGFTVVDANGTVVGTLVDATHVARNIDGVEILFKVDIDGILPHFTIPGDITLTAATYYYESTDCTGLPYMPKSFLLWDHFTVHRGYEGIFYFPGNPTQLLTFHSSRDAKFDGTFSECIPAGDYPFTFYSGPPRSFDISTLGLVPPFRVQ